MEQHRQRGVAQGVSANASACRGGVNPSLFGRQVRHLALGSHHARSSGSGAVRKRRTLV